MNGTSTATASQAPSIASSSRPIPCATRRSSGTSAPWRWRKGEIVVANPENWLISDGKLYVFGKPAPSGPACFQQDLAANIAKANQNRPSFRSH